jgi:hypothetical protein
MLRRYEAFAPGCSVGPTRTRALVRCAHVGLACLALLVVSAPAALAAPKDPKPAPQKLWEAFPLNPTGERLGRSQETAPAKPASAKPARAKPVPVAPLLPPTTSSTPQGTQAAGDDVDPASGTNLALFALAAGLLVLLAGGLVTVRLRAGHTQVRSARLWEGTRGLDTGPGAGAQRHPDISGRVRQRSGLVRPRVTRSSRASRRVVHRRPSPQALARNLARPARRLQEAVWTPDTAPAIVGAAMAVVLAYLIVRFVG